MSRIFLTSTSHAQPSQATRVMHVTRFSGGQIDTLSLIITWEVLHLELDSVFFVLARFPLFHVLSTLCVLGEAVTKCFQRKCQENMFTLIFFCSGNEAF